MFLIYSFCHPSYTEENTYQKAHILNVSFYNNKLELRNCCPSCRRKENMAA